MDSILFNLLVGTRTRASADEIAAASSMVTALAGPTHQEHWTTHPLGFFHFAEDIGAGTRVRVHVWPRAWAVPDEQAGGEIHDHVFDLRSLVVFGSIKNAVFEAVEVESGDCRLFNVEYGPGISHVIPSARTVRLSQSSSSVYSAREIYGVEAGVLHCSSAETTPAITLVLTAPASMSKHPVVALSAAHRPPPTFQRRSLTSPELNLLLLIEAVEHLC